MDYVTFGKGKQPLVIIPGLGDGLQIWLKVWLCLFQSHTVYLPNVTKFMFFLESMSWRQGYTTRDMAADVAEAMEALNLDTSYVMGISQGGNDCPMVDGGFP